MAMLYSPRSVADFPEHVLSLLVESLGFPRSIRCGLNSQSIQSSNYLTIPSSPNIQPNLLPIEEQVVSQSIARFVVGVPRLRYFGSAQYESAQVASPLENRLQQSQDCMMKVAEIVRKSKDYYLEGIYWRCHQPIELDESIDRVFIDPNHPMITHANYLFEPDLLTISIDRGHFQGNDSTKASLCEGDRYLLDFIHPHLVQAYQNSIALTNIQQQLAESSRSKTPLFSVEAIQSLGLTKRESEVLCAIAQDKSNSDIAIALECSLSTVKKHLEHIYEKLEVQTRTAAVMTALVRLGSISGEGGF